MSSFREGERVQLTVPDDERIGWRWPLVGQKGVVVETYRIGTPHEAYTVELDGHEVITRALLYKTDTANFTAESIEPEESLA